MMNMTPCRPAAVLHYFRCDRPGQIRGIPDITPALPLFAQLRRFTLAVLAAAETAAEFAGILYTDAPANGEADAAEPFEPIELEKRMLLTMPGGWKMAQMKSEQPSTTYAEFKKEILNEIARCLNMPFNVAAGNSSGYNYASRAARPPNLLQVDPRRAITTRSRCARSHSERLASRSHSHRGLSAQFASHARLRPSSTNGFGTATSMSIPPKKPTPKRSVSPIIRQLWPSNLRGRGVTGRRNSNSVPKKWH